MDAGEELAALEAHASAPVPTGKVRMFDARTSTSVDVDDTPAAFVPLMLQGYRQVRGGK